MVDGCAQDMAVLASKRFAFLPSKTECDVRGKLVPFLGSSDSTMEAVDILSYISLTLGTKTYDTFPHIPRDIASRLRGKAKTSDAS